MPRMDGTGPAGEGTGTGRRQGRCGGKGRIGQPGLRRGRRWTIAPSIATSPEDTADLKQQVMLLTQAVKELTGKFALPH